MQEPIGKTHSQIPHKEDEEPVTEGVASTLSAPFTHGREIKKLGNFTNTQICMVLGLGGP